MHKTNINKGGTVIPTYEKQINTEERKLKGKKLFVFDLTGTLLNKNEGIDPEIIYQIKKIYKKNHYVAITSSNSYQYCIDLLKPIIDFIHFFVGNNGSILIDNIKGELMKTPKTLNMDFINEILKDVKLLGGAVQIITSKKVFVNSYINIFKSEEWLSEKAIERNINQFSEYEINSMRQNQIIQLSIIINPNYINQFLVYLKQLYCNDYEFKKSSKINIDINLSGVNKYEGIKTIMLLYQINEDNVFSFGNSTSDLEVIKNTHNSYAMANSDLVVKEFAQNIIQTSEDDTVALEIQKILKK
ncbi:MAG: HAD-IIB family hydrolase [Mycoplasmataceae bacterium]|nr:HAD-IIB family hydrolase [Mycoplasmataceae bacterium]